MDFNFYLPPVLSPLQTSCTVSMDICTTSTCAFPARMKLPIAGSHSTMEPELLLWSSAWGAQRL